MMDCITTRRTLLADPTGTAEVAEHLGSCPGCQAFAKNLNREAALLRHAMEVPVPDQLQERILLQTALQRRPNSFITRLREFIASLSLPTQAGIAMAFSFVLAVGIWNYQPAYDPHLNWSEVVLAHVIGEPDAMAASGAIPRDALVEAFDRYGLAPTADIGTARFVERCVVPGGRGMHIVIDTHRLGRVSLILPPTGLNAVESSARRDGYAATMVSIAGVSIGVVTDEPEKLPALTALLRNVLTRHG